MKTSRFLSTSLTVVLALSVCGTALGQSGRGGAGRAQSAGGSTQPSSVSFGVKAQIPPPIGISRRGTLLNRTGTLLPPSPTVPRHGSGQYYRPQPRPTYPTARPDLDGRPIHIGPGYVGNPGNITDSTGVVIDGKARGDHWNLKFHLGSGYTYSPWWKPWHYQEYGGYGYRSNYGYGLNYGLWSYPWSYCGGYNSYYAPPLVYGQVDPYVMTGVNPAAVYAAAYGAQPQQPEREPTPLEKADALMMYGDSKAAAEAYRAYLEGVPDDAAAMRSLALALLNERRFDEAVAVIAMAYEKQPRLARTAIDPAVSGGSTELRKRLNAAVTYANRVGSGSSWLLVVALMQAEGRDSVALRMTERAREAGLSESIATEFTDVLKQN